jgi:homogentisate 1,2-dioxygenase
MLEESTVAEVESGRGQGSKLSYLSGFGNELWSEALPGALPVGQSSPQVPAHGLVHELISGTTFTAPRRANRRVHLYRIRPSTTHGELRPMESGRLLSGPFATAPNPNQMRWGPFEVPEQPQDFLDSLMTLCGNGSVSEQTGMAMHVYTANRSMTNRAFSNADGEFVIIPQQGDIRCVTELGVIEAGAGEIVLIPRGCKFRVELRGASAQGFVCENYGVPFQLPDLGLIGSTGQANAWDFEIPVAAYEDAEVETQLVHKYVGRLWTTVMDHSPFDVVAWRGNYTPAKYDMHRFVVLGAVAFDHAEPSIYCALTSPSDSIAGPNADFMIFPPRWMVAEHTFRPPGFHRNSVAEFLGLIQGRHDGKSAAFRPGSVSLHNSWAPHGPDTASYEAGRTGSQDPQHLSDSLVFMFESRYPMSVTEAGLNCLERQTDYIDCWGGFRKRFG